jgi:hypothetical protein
LAVRLGKRSPPRGAAATASEHDATAFFIAVPALGIVFRHSRQATLLVRSKHPPKYTEQEAAQRGDRALRQVRGRPPQPHKPLGAAERKSRPASKGRVHKAKSRS